MDWKEIDLIDPLRRPMLPIGKKSVQVSNILNLLNSTNSKEDTVLDYLKSEWLNLCGPAAKKSVPTKIEFNNLLIYCDSASARQDIVMRWPRIQRQIQHQFSYQFKSVRFDKNSKSLTEISLKLEPKINEVKHKKTDTTDKDVSLIEDIREILNI